MLIDERQNQILEIIKEKVFVRVDELAARVYASPATIRRDLALLDQAGLIQRLHGEGAVRRAVQDPSAADRGVPRHLQVEAGL